MSIVRIVGSDNSSMETSVLNWSELHTENSGFIFVQLNDEY